MSLEAHLKVFDLHDASYSKSLSKKEIANVLRSCGRLATSKEMEELLKPYRDPMTRNEFTEMVTSLSPGPKETDLQTALQAFDHKELGTLTRVELSSIFTQMTERMPSSELDKLLRGLEFDSEDRVAIDHVVKRFMAPTQSLHVPPNEICTRIQQS